MLMQNPEKGDWSLEPPRIRVAVVGVSREIGGAAKATWRMFVGLKNSKDALEYCLYCSEGSQEKGDSVNRIPWRGGLWATNALGGSSLTRKILDIKLRIWTYIMVRRRSKHQFFYADSLVSKKEIEARCSLVHYVWIQLISSSLTRPTRPYVVTMHDMWQLTGGCAYTLGCKEMEHGCNDCPEVREYAKRQVRRMKQEKLRFLNGAHYIVVTSRWMRDEAIKAGVSPEKIVRIENYIPEIFQYNEKKKLLGEQYVSAKPRRRRRVYFVGSITDKRKGFETLVEVLKQEEEFRMMSWELSVLGCEDIELEEIRNAGIYARGYGILHDDASQVEMYNRADILVCPSQEDNSPNVVAEAHCCGLPVVVIDKTGAAEMVDDNLNGWIARDGSLKEIAKTLSTALSQYSKLDRGAISRQARDRYGRKNTIEKYSKLYMKVVLGDD